MFFFSNRRESVRNNIRLEFERLTSVKWYSVVKVQMDRRDASGNIVDTATPVFRSTTVPVLVADVVDDQINDAYLKMIRSFDAFRESGSGWALSKVIHLEITITKYNPLRGACCQYRIPENIMRKQCILNVTGPPELNGHCFKYSVLAALHSDPGHVGNLPWSELHRFRNTLSFEGINGSGQHMPVTSIPDFEKLNSLSINLYGCENDIFPLHITKAYRRDRHINLLLLPERETENDTENEVENFSTIANQRSPHYCVVKDMGRLLSSQVDGNNPTFVCMQCLATKTTAESLAAHEKICAVNENHIKYFMPTDKEKFLKFRNYGRKMKVSFVDFASFAWYTSPIYANDEPTIGFEVRERKLDCCAYSYHRISVDDSHPSEVHYYRGTSPEDTMLHFLNAMKREEEEVFEIQRNTAPMIIDDDGLRNIQASNDECFVCNDTFIPGERIGLDHSHVSGKVRGRIHCDSCNLRLKEANFLPVFVQNLSQCEGRLIMQAVGQFGANSVKVIPKTLDTYVSITVNKCRFLDFSRFLKVSLNELVISLRAKSGVDAFKSVRKHISPERLDVAINRHVFCHDYLDFEHRLNEVNIPPKVAFFDRINNYHITDEEYEHVHRFWETFQCATIEDFLRHHLQLQSLLFADVAENFRDTLMQNYKLDCFWYYSLPGFSFDACLHHTDVVLELMQDEKMHHIILAGLRGGVTQIGSPREVRASNPDSAPDFNPNEPISYLHFFDFNSLYPSVMHDFPLPTSGFRYLNQHEIDAIDITQLTASDDKRYIFVVDLEYPDKLHHLHDQFPLAPENITTGPKDMSDYTINLAERCGLKLKDERKICLTLRPKSRYAVHYLTLQHYFKHGIVVSAIHDVITFYQSKWLQRFVKLTCENRKQAENQFDNMLHKNGGNHTFGKTIENVFNRIKVKICTSAKDLQKAVKKPTFQAIRVFSDNVAAVQMCQETVRLTKPIAVGFSILELSKLRMYELFYDFLVKEFKDGKVDLVYSDTDSFLVNIKGIPDVDNILWKNKHRFDFSSLPDDHKLKDDSNRQVPGKMKFQLGGSVCKEAVVLSSKCYSVLTNDGNKSALKGTNTNVVHERYRECLRSEISIKGQTKSVRNFGQQLYHVSTEKNHDVSCRDKTTLYQCQRIT